MLVASKATRVTLPSLTSVYSSRPYSLLLAKSYNPVVEFLLSYIKSGGHVLTFKTLTPQLSYSLALRTD